MVDVCKKWNQPCMDMVYWETSIASEHWRCWSQAVSVRSKNDLSRGGLK